MRNPNPDGSILMDRTTGEPIVYSDGEYVHLSCAHREVAVYAQIHNPGGGNYLEYHKAHSPSCPVCGEPFDFQIVLPGQDTGTPEPFPHFL